MITENDIIADFHVHTNLLDHGWSTLHENVTIATERGIKYLAITDHYEPLLAINVARKVLSLTERMRDCDKRLVVLNGMEFNLWYDDPSIAKFGKCLWRPVGYHPNRYRALSVEERMLWYKLAARGDMAIRYHAFNHIERGFPKGMSADTMLRHCEEIVDIAVENEIFLEVNESSLRRGDTEAHVLVSWVMYALFKGAHLVLGSDAHYCMEVGNFPLAINILNTYGYPKDLILNCNEQYISDVLLDGRFQINDP